MQFHNERDEAVTLKHIEHAVFHLKNRIILESIPLSATLWTSPERLPFAQRRDGEQRAIAEGDEWGKNWSSGWFHLTGTVPENWRGAHVQAWLVIDGEGLVHDAEGRALQGITNGSVFDIAATRAFIDLFASAKGGETVELWLEGAANDIMGIAPADCWSGGHWDRPTGPDRCGTFTAKVQRLRLARVDRQAWDLRWDMEVLLDLVNGLPKASVRRARAMKALDDVATILASGGSDAEARARLAPELAKPANASDIPVRAVGHAHIDTAWLWPIAETKRKIARTFASQLALIEKYPGYVFGASAPQHYAWIKESHPDLYARIKEAVTAGRWELQGGMWIECDCNLPAGESLVRQFIHGKNFFRDEFGVDVDNLWIPDVFGYAASLPQIMAQCGVTTFLTQKISWNQYNIFPYHTFWWQGIDGTRILTHFPPENTYNAEIKADSLIAAQERFAEKAFAPEMMSLFGIGDGGGGPREDMLERAKRVANLEGCPPVKLGRACDFFKSLHSVADQLQTWVGELYLELHRGTLTTQAKVKKANRRIELRLRELEMLWSLRPADYPIAAFDALWKETLLHQFHDIIPGSSINAVYQDTHAAHERLLQTCDALQADFAAALPPSDGVTLFNSLSTPWRGVVTLPADFGAFAAVVNGQAVPTQREENDTVALVEIPAQGFVTVTRGSALAAASAIPSPTTGPITLDNGAARFVINEHGHVTEASIGGRNLLRAAGNVLSLYNDRPLNWDAWDIDHHYRKELIDEAAFTVEDLGRGPVRHRLRLTARIGESSVTQIVTLAAGSSRLDFATTVDWRETHRMLRVAFPTAVRTDRASAEIQYGHIFRPTHENTLWDKAKFEVAAQRWADLSEPGHGIALLNDCKYGHRLTDNILDLALLRAPTSPDPDADLGTHTFTYSLLPHAGDLVASAVIEEAAALNQPPVVLSGRAAPAAPMPATLQGDGVELAVLKRAEKSTALVVRLVENRGRHTTATLRLPQPGRLVPCDLLEWHEGEPTAVASEHALTFSPFQIRTFLLRA